MTPKDIISKNIKFYDYGECQVDNDQLEKDIEDYAKSKMADLSKDKIIQLLSDASCKIGKTYEERAVLDSDFYSISESILKLLKP